MGTMQYRVMPGAQFGRWVVEMREVFVTPLSGRRDVTLWAVVASCETREAAEAEVDRLRAKA
jgi:hypothetical protein